VSAEEKCCHGKYHVEVNSHPHSGWLEHAPKGSASRVTLVPMGLLFMNPSSKARGFIRQ